MARKKWDKLRELLNPPELEEEDRYPGANGDAVRYILKRFYSPFWFRISCIIIISSLLAFSQFFYTWCTKYAADSVIQVDVLAKAVMPDVDPTLPTESRNFHIDGDTQHKSWSQRWDNYVGKTNSQRKTSLLILLIVAIIGVALDYCGNYFYGRWVVAVGQKVQYRMRHRVYDSLQSLPMEYHDSQSVGSMLVSLFNDIRVIQFNLMQMIRQLVFNVASIIIGACILLVLNPGLAGLTFLSLPFYLVTYRWFRDRLEVVHNNLRYQEGSLNAHMTNRVKNFYLVKSYVNEGGETKDFFKRSKSIISNSIIANLLGTTFTILCGLISGLSMVLVLYRSTMAVKAGTMTPGDLLMFYTSAGLLFNPISTLSSVATTYQVLATRCEKIRRILTEPLKLTSGADPIPVSDDAPSLEFRDVAMKYQSSRTNALDAVNFTLPAGKTLCVMGASGSGKSTLAKLAARIYDPTGGTVLLGGNDIRDYRLSELRKVVGYVNQEPIIFGGTLKENIRYGTNRAAENDIISAARRAQIHEYIVSLPERYETMAAERGQTLSGGQKQRVNIARVLLYGPKFLILDDCTSALDADTEARLIREFDTILEDRTAVIISHRLAMALCCDYILILDGGKVVEFDRLDKLLDSDSRFREMMDEQVNRAARDVFKNAPVHAGA